MTAPLSPAPHPHAATLGALPVGAVAVIFTSMRTDLDDAGYAAAADAMEGLAKSQPGYLGFVAVRGSEGIGIATSYWTDDDAAKAWRDHPDHADVRNAGRDRWYVWTHVSVARIERRYSWALHGTAAHG